MILSFNMSIIHYIIDIISQFVAPNKRNIEEPKELLTFKLFLCPLHEMFHSHMKHNYFLKKYTSNTVLDENISTCINYDGLSVRSLKKFVVYQKRISDWVKSDILITIGSNSLLVKVYIFLELMVLLIKICMCQMHIMNGF